MATGDLEDVLFRVRDRYRAGGGPLHAPASPLEIRHAEARLGFTLPESLRRFHTEVANGGVGPVLLYGVGSGWRSPDGEDLVGVYECRLQQSSRADPERPGGRPLSVAVEAWPACVLPLAEPRDGVLFCIDAPTGEVLSGEGHATEHGLRHADWLQREAPSLEAWLARWLDGEDPPHRPRGPWGGR